MSVTAFPSALQMPLPSPALKMHRSAKRKPFAITEVYSLLLQGVYEHYLVLAEQLTQRYYAAATIKHVERRLKELVEHKYLNYLQLHTAKGSGPYVYFLATKGRRYFQDAGCDLKRYYRPSKEKDRSYFHLMHTLELNDCLVKAYAFARMTEGVSITQMQHDFTLRRKPIKVAVKSRENGVWKEIADEIVADAWLSFLLPDNSRRWLWLEHDRGEASRKKIQEHVRGILAFIQAEGYTTEFGASGMTVAYTTSGGTSRREKLREWTREVLMEHAKQTNQRASFGNWFLFTTVPPLRTQPLEPKTLFQENVWYHPFGNKPTAMFRKS
jgi:hypothetical protein